MIDEFEFDLEDDEEEIKKFICPECNSEEPGEEILISKEPSPNKKSKSVVECNAASGM